MVDSNRRKCPFENEQVFVKYSHCGEISLAGRELNCIPKLYPFAVISRRIYLFVRQDATI